MTASFHSVELISGLREELNRMFNEALQLGGRAGSGDWQPQVDVIESADTVTVLAETPGISPDDLTVETTGDLLTIRGTKPRPADPPRVAHFHRVERRHGSFTRQIHLRQAVNSRQGRARLVDGLLTIEFPKVINQRRRPHRLEIETSDGSKAAEQID